MPSIFNKVWHRVKLDRKAEIADDEVRVKQVAPSHKTDDGGTLSSDGQFAPTPAASLAKGQEGLSFIGESAPGSRGSSLNFPLDIVFVHGLNGDSKSTWTHGNGTFWPRDLLSADMPGSRIYSYGYDSKIFFSPSDAEYRDFALDLMEAVRGLEFSTGRAQPIVFVCHSLGGIIVKEAVNIASDRDWTQKVLARCRGFVFLGTPHRGSGIAGPAGVISGILNAVWSPATFVLPGPRGKLLTDLERSSKVLFAIADRFAGRTQSIEIASFYETNQTLPLGKVVVDENSGVLGLPHERRRPMPVDHHQICRFENQNDVNYRKVLSAIREIATLVLPQDGGANTELSFTHSEQECILQLNTVDITEFEAQIEERLPETLLWLSTDIYYSSWLSESSGAPLLVTGYAGCGKTVLSSYLRTQLPIDYQRASVICRFYCDAKVQELRSVVVLMRSIIFQAVLRSHELLRMVVKAAKYDKWLWGSFERLWTLFEKLTAANEDGQLVVIIDAIDELDEATQQQLSSHILQLMRSEGSRSTKFLITSQPHASAVAELRHHSVRLSLENRPDLLMNDVCAFIRHRVKKLRTQKYWSESLCEQLVVMLERKADRSFLWVSFALSMLAKRDIVNIEALEGALAAIPPDLTMFYDRFLRTLTVRENTAPALTLLNMILSSRRALNAKELSILLAVNLSHRSIADVWRDRAIGSVHSIQTVLGPLVKSYDERVQLVHTTLKEYLDTNGAELGVSQRKGHEVLAERCLLYLLMQDSHSESVDSVQAMDPSSSRIRSSPVDTRPVLGESSIDEISDALHTLFAEPERYSTTDLGPGFELHDYAVRFWAIHFQQSNCSPTDTLFLLALDLYGKSRYWEEYAGRTFTAPEYPRNPDALSISCFYGHHKITEHLLEKTQFATSSTGAALHWAAARGNMHCVKLMISCMQPKLDTASCYLDGVSPFACAAANGHADVVAFFIAEKAFGVSDEDSQGQRPLSLAVAQSRTAVVSMLLSTIPRGELDVNHQDHRGWSAIFMACSSDQPHLVSQLLADDRTNANTLDQNGRSALSWACEDGLANTVRTLVDHKVRLGDQDKRGMTPLMYAIRSRDFRTVKALFRNCKDLNSSADASDINTAARDHHGRNAISWAASIHEGRILELLLRYCPEEANVPDASGWLPLAWTLNPPGFLQNAEQLMYYSFDSIDVRDYAGNSLVSIAIAWARWDIARVLLEKTSIDVNAQNHNGRTALSLAAASGSLAMVKQLIGMCSAKTYVADSTGRLPVDWARDAGHHEIAAYLVDSGKRSREGLN